MIKENKNNFSSEESENDSSLVKVSSELNVESLYQILIQNPYLVNSIDGKNETMLSYSIKNDNSEISNLILTSPIIDLDFQDNNGNSYLHLAVISKDEEIIKSLIEKGIDTNKQNKDGNTALHLAYELNEKNIIDYLIENGIDKTIKNKNNLMADEMYKNQKSVLKSNKKENLSSAKVDKRVKNSSFQNLENNNENSKSNKSNKSNRAIKSIKSAKIIKANNNQNLSNKNKSKMYEFEAGSNLKKEKKYICKLNKKQPDFEKTVKIDWDITKQKINIDLIKDETTLNKNKSLFNKDSDICNIEDLNLFDTEQKSENSKNNEEGKNHKFKKIIKGNNFSKNSTKSVNINEDFTKKILIESGVEITDKLITERKDGDKIIMKSESSCSNSLKKTNDDFSLKSPNIGILQNIKKKPKIKNKRNNPLIEFLSQINLIKYLSIFENNGFDDINLLIEEAKKGNMILDQELKECGIYLPGDRAKILIRIKEKANLFGFSVPKKVYYICKNFDEIERDENIINLNNWLTNLKMDDYLMNFVTNGYHSIELLLIQMETDNPITSEMLRDEFGIDKVGYRSRIINKLKEEGKNLICKLKSSVLLLNNRPDDKNCECIII